MIKEIKSVIARSSATLMHDTIGAVSLMVFLVGALHLPSLL